MKRTISILLAAIMLVSCAVISVSAYSWNDADVKTVEQAVEDFRADYELLYGKELQTYRYYFLMPNGSNGDLGDDPTLESNGKFAPSWYNEMTETAGIYWWDTKILDPSAWIGYIGMKGDAEDVYYADVPTFVTGIVWNNGVDGGKDDTQPQFYKAAQSADIGSEYYDAGESDNYPDGTENFDNMIYVIDPDKVSKSDYSGMLTCGGEWYYYYGNGCYGFTPDGTEADCLRDDHHDADGNHVIPVHDPIPEAQKPEPLPTYIIGDVDNDGAVSIMDATEIQMVLAMVKEWAYEGADKAADVDEDGTPSVMDATEIQLWCAQLIPTLPR